MPLLPGEGGARPEVNARRPLEVPTSPKREHLMDVAGALGRYVDEGGAAELFYSEQSDGRMFVGFEVERLTYNRTEATVRKQRTGNGPWVWMPKRGLHRRRPR